MIRQAGIADCKELAQIENLCFSEPWNEDMLKEAVSFEKGLFLVETESQTIRAYIGAVTVLDEIHIANIAVRPEYRGQGLAKSLIERLLQFAKDNAYSGLTLEVRESNAPAISLYKKYGFFEEGRRRKYYTNPDEDALLMWKRL